MENKEMITAQGRAGTDFVEKSETSAAIDLINDLIVTNRGIIDVYQTAAERLEDETNRQLLQGYAKQHESFVAELSNLVVSYGDNPTTSNTGSKLLKQAWVTLKAAVTEGDGPILAEVAQDAQNVLEAYGEAMGTDLPDDSRELIRRHMSEVRLVHEKLSALSTAYNQ